MNTMNKWFLSGLLLLLTIIPATGIPYDLDINCVDYYPGPPDCCTVVSESAGEGATYMWSTQYGHGSVEPATTDYPWSHFTCDLYYTGSEHILNVIFQQPLTGHGMANCDWGS